MVVVQYLCVHVSFLIYIFTIIEELLSSTVSAATKKKRKKKAEADAAKAAELAKKFGICCVPIRVAYFIAGKFPLLYALPVGR